MERNSEVCSSALPSKICSTCNRRLGLYEFGKKKQNSDGLCGSCKDCKNTANKRYYRNAKPSRKRVWDLNRYGLTPKAFDEMRQRQNNACAICKQPTALCVDHCHISKIVRGLLCDQCNRGLGMFQDDPFRLVSAIEYLGGWYE